MGIRRCGKSCLLFNLFMDYLLAEGVDEQHSIEIAFDFFENKRFHNPEVLYPYLMKRFVKCFFELLTQILISATGNGRGKESQNTPVDG